MNHAYSSYFAVSVLLEDVLAVKISFLDSSLAGEEATADVRFEG
jgi:hypothetical protein